VNRAASPRPPLLLRFLAIGLGIAFFIWLPFEDSSLAWVVLLAAGLCALLAWAALQRQSSPGWLRLALAGGLAGLLVAPAALLLVAVKTGLHGHGFSDFTPAQVESLLRLAPAWTFAGLAIGAGIAMLARRA
jgi:hypothetical protein